MPRTRIAHTLGDWEKLTQGVDAETTAAAPQIKPIYEQLLSYLEEIHKLSLEQNYHESQKQQATRRINEILEEGRIAATALKVNLRQHLGNRNEELVRFGIRPLRSRKRPAKKSLPPDDGTSA